MRFKSNWTGRTIDFVFPREANPEIYAFVDTLIDEGVYFETKRSGPAIMLSGNRVSSLLHNTVILVDENHADRYISTVKAICQRYEVPEDEWARCMPEGENA